MTKKSRDMHKLIFFIKLSNWQKYAFRSYSCYKGNTRLFVTKVLLNNLAKNINSRIKTRVHLTVPKTPEGLEQRFQGYITVINEPEILGITIVLHRFSPKILSNEWNNSEIKQLFQLNEKWGKKIQTEVLVN
ncbi:MAG: hypothetical protein K9W44_15060 [Candidatus Lokiarchaeota archaeon]|nr:hypothetical protein [Candidatus Harpocratesius repetitus]